MSDKNDELSIVANDSRNLSQDDTENTENLDDQVDQVDQSSDGDGVATDDPHNILKYAPAESQYGVANNPTGSDANSEAV